MEEYMYVNFCFKYIFLENNDYFRPETFDPRQIMGENRSNIADEKFYWISDIFGISQGWLILCENWDIGKF